MHVERFLTYLQHEKRYSQHTLTSYKNDLQQFSNFLEAEYSITEPQDITHQFIRSWLVHLSEQNTGTRSINRKISTLRSYFKFLLKRKLVEKDPTLKVIAPKVEKRLPEYVEVADMEKVLHQIDYGEGFSGMRDRMLIATFYFTGIRLSELISLKESDVNLLSKQMKVLGKGNKERIIPLSENILTDLTLYIEEKKRLFPTGMLFITDKGKALYPKFVYRKVNKCLSLVTTMSKKSPHVLRHTFATHLANKGADINAIKELLGHADLSATQVYTHNNIERLKDVYKQAHPKS